MSLLVLLLVGLVAGWLATKVVGEAYGLVGDIAVGVAGSFLGAWLLRTLGVRLPLSGLPNTILVAFIGAVSLLLLLRLIRRLRTA